MKLARIAAAIAVTTALAAPLAASAQWWGDDPYWKNQLSGRPSTEAPAAPRSGETDLFGRRIVRMEGTEGFTPFYPLPAFWANRYPEQPTGYAAQGTTVRDVPTVDEAPERTSGAAIVEGANSERNRLQQNGFPQFVQ